MTRAGAARHALDPAVLVLLVLLPLLVHSGYALRILSIGWLYAILAMGVVVSYGHAGIPNMSQGTLYGIGAYAGANLMSHSGMPFLAAAVGGGLVAAAAGGLLGATALRVRGNYWWLITIAFTQVLYIVFNSWNAVTGGEGGFVGIPLGRIGSIVFTSNRSFYYLGLGALALIYFTYRRVCSSRVGLAMRAVRRDETASRGLGLSPGALKIASMLLAGLGAGVAGVCLDAITGYINANTFSLTFSFNMMLFAIVGGILSLRGSVIAAVVLTYITTDVTSLVNDQLFIFGGVVLIALLLRLYLAEGSLGALRWRLTAHWRATADGEPGSDERAEVAKASEAVGG
jgi:branched-chain amino acid transport system permease protein